VLAKRDFHADPIENIGDADRHVVSDAGGAYHRAFQCRGVLPMPWYRTEMRDPAPRPLQV